jgi:N-acetylneuraminic acid mutarotase
MPTARTGLRLVASGRYLYAIGGAAPPSGADPSEIGPSLSTVERYDPKSDSWATMNPMVESRVLPCAVQTRVGNRHVLVVVGGAEFSADGTPVQARRTTEVFDPATGRWTLLDVLLPIGRGSHDCATEADGTVLAIGGITPVGGTPVFLANVDALSLKPRDLRSH